MARELLSPVGRIVWGNPGKAKIKTDKYNNPVIKDGQQVEQWAFGIAIPKEEFQQHVWPVMAEEIATGYPQGIPPNFSYKYKDGDGVDHEGKPFANREGYAGCMILTISTEAFAPPLYKLNPQSGTYVQFPSEQIKTGHHVRVSLNLKVNVPTDKSHTPGIYVNPNGVEHIAYDTEIVNGPNAQEMFGSAAPAAIPAGASATPVGNSNVPGMPVPGQQPYAPQAPAQQPYAPQAPAQQPYAPQAPAQQPYAPQAPAQQPMPAPAQNFIPGQPAPPAQQPMAAPAQPQYAQQPVPGAMPPR